MKSRPAKRSAMILLASFTVASVVAVGVLVRGEPPESPSGRSVSDLSDIERGGSVQLQQDVIETDTPLSIPEGTKLDGNGATIRYTGGGRTALLLQKGVEISDLRVVATGHTRSVVMTAQDASGVSLESVDVIGVGSQQSGINVARGSHGTTIAGGDIRTVKNGIRVREDVADMSIRDIHITDWSNRGIWVHGAAGRATTGLTISQVAIGPNNGFGGSRQPIIVRSTGGARHKDVHIVGVSTRGPGTSFDDPSRPGTGDQISVVNTDGLVIERCRSVDGGERGINVTDATDVTVRANFVAGSDAVGIGIGSAAESKAVSDVTVESNVVEDTGTSRTEGTTDYSLSGIRFSNVTNGRITANTIRKARHSKNPRYGIVVDYSRSVTVGTRNIVGDFRRSVLDGGNNTSLRLEGPS